MDQTQRQVMRHGDDEDPDRPPVGGLIFGGLVLIVGGIIMLLQSHAGVADFGGAILGLIGLALIAGGVWTATGSG